MLKYAIKWMGNLTQKFIIVSEVRQAQKVKYCMIPLVEGTQNRLTLGSWK